MDAGFLVTIRSPARSGSAPGASARLVEGRQLRRLSRLISRTEFPSQDDFVDGALQRYLELVAASPGRGGARMMEFAAASIRAYVERERQRGRPTGALEAAIDAKVRTHFSSGSDNDAYMIEVFEGRATHNFRASLEPEDEDGD